MAPQSKTLLQAVTEDHQEIYTYYNEYLGNAHDSEAQGRWARQLTWELTRHAVGEEIIIFPLMEKHLGDQGKKLADEDRKDHQYIKERLYRLDELTPGTSEHASLLKDIMEHLKPHNDSEEQRDLPLLELALGLNNSEIAAASFTRTKKFVPTRSHPNAPNKPPFETFVALMEAPIDKLKDVFASFPSDEEIRQARN